MDIKGLQYFVAAAERLNFTVAAKECYITQTAMSLHIKKMEDELGFKLFTRGKHAIGLTDAGRDFYMRSREIILSYESAVRHSAGVSGGVIGVIDIMLPSCIEGFVLMDSFRSFSEQYPDIKLNVSVEPPGLHIDCIRSGRADICIGAPDDMELDGSFAVERLREDSVAILCGKYHPLARRKTVTVEMVSRETAVVCGPKGIPNAFRTLRNNRLMSGLDSDMTLSVNNMDEMLLAIELGRGVGFLPGFVRRHLPYDMSGLVFLKCDFNGNPPTMTTAAGYLRDNPNAAIRNLLRSLKYAQRRETTALTHETPNSPGQQA
ncbi:MAG: LysR family transcriptional regulator [Oscillospiraceae bacterium]|nr:LysR family transcriptional regulator [Oscillospiraceae bacterium]